MTCWLIVLEDLFCFTCKQLGSHILFSCIEYHGYLQIKVYLLVVEFLLKPDLVQNFVVNFWGECIIIVL
jgi:hypothetical protein